MPSMSMSSLPLAQSMRISFADWKQDPYNVIADDEPRFSDIVQSTAEFSAEPHALYQESWGCYFAQKSGAMGDISGTSRVRVRIQNANS